jgi:hypothetical protein
MIPDRSAPAEDLAMDQHRSPRTDRDPEIDLCETRSWFLTSAS